MSKKLDISWPSTEFFDKCKSWEPYDDASMNVCISVARGYQLPDEVFGEGEKKPEKPLKSGKRKRLEANADDARTVGVNF